MFEMASLTESTLFSKLESSTSLPIFSLFSDYLSPFSALRNPDNLQRLTLTRSLAKKFLPFLNRSLSILPKRLSSQTLDLPRPLSDELFATYRLCLDCVDSVSSQLSCKPYAVLFQRLRLVYCFEARGLFVEAEGELVRVLDKFRVLEPGGGEEGFLPRVGESADSEMGRLVVEVAVAVVRCVAARQSEEGDDYRRIIRLVEEVRPWLRVLDSSTHGKLHQLLVTNLAKCSLFLIRELRDLIGVRVQFFCLTLNEYAKSSMKNQIYKFVRRIFSSLFELLDNRDSFIEDIFKCVLDVFVRECKVDMENCEVEFVEFVSYCCYKCRSTNLELYDAVAKFLNDLAARLSQDTTPMVLILRFYAAGLSFTAVHNTTTVGDVKFMVDELFVCCNLATLLDSLHCYKGSPNQKLLQPHHEELPLSHPQQNKKTYVWAFKNALKFLCEPLAELVNSQKKEILIGNHVSIGAVLCDIQGAFDEFFDTVWLVNSSEGVKDEGVKDEDESDDIKIILHVAVALLTLSIRSKSELQKNVDLIQQKIICSKWVQPQGLRYIFASLHNLSVILHRNERENLFQALEALKLLCKTSWACLITLCEKFMNLSCSSHGDLSENAMFDLVNEACAQTASLLEVLTQCGVITVKEMLVFGLEQWSVVEDLLGSVPGPIPLVKQWVKVVCRLNENVGRDNGGPTLFSLLPSSLTEKNRGKKLAKILQQELLSYEQMETLHPDFCQIMQMKVIDILLNNVYANKDNWLQRSEILIRKGWALRATGVNHLRESVDTLSEAISIIEGEKCSSGSPICHQLGVAHCLRALSYQELEPNSKQVLQDIKAAVIRWLSVANRSCACDGESLFSGSSLLLLYNIIDFLSIKVSMQLYEDLYKLVLKLFNSKDVPLKKCISVLWESRRLSHALCVSPVNYKFVMSLSEEFGESCDSFNFWTSCLKGCTPSLVGFLQNFEVLFKSMPCGPYHYEIPHRLDDLVDDVKRAASELISSVPVTSRAVFVAGYLYYDLSERLLAGGRLFEALLCAKEAHLLRSRLFQENFMYTVEQKIEKSFEAHDHLPKLSYSIRNLQLHRLVARQVCLFSRKQRDLEAFYLSPWKVLESYLESTLQVGVVHEMIGNGVEAECFLLWGRDISHSQSLPLFMVRFSSVLGKLYRKKHCWDLAEEELNIAKEILSHSCKDLSCSNCKVMLDVIIDQQLGDLYRSRCFSPRRIVQMEEIRTSKSYFRSALEKLKGPMWQNSISCPEEVQVGSGNAFTCSFSASLCPGYLASAKTLGKTKMGSKNSKKLKNAAKSLHEEQHSTSTYNSRMTRSRYRSQNHEMSSCTGAESSHLKHLEGNNEQDLPHTIIEAERISQRTCEPTCICKKINCWMCIAKEVKECGLISKFIHLKWELQHRRLSLRVLASLGKCMGDDKQIHESHVTVVQSILLLIGRNPFCSAPISMSLLLNVVDMELSGDVFTLERVAILYHLCLFSLKSRSGCCDLANIELPKIVSWLMLAFVHCREVPFLFQKISRLLSVIFVCSSSGNLVSFGSNYNSLSESHWASFFHQASIGTHLSCQFLFNGNEKAKSDEVHLQCSLKEESVSTEEACKLPRLGPESLQDMAKFVTDFFLNLPCTSIICVSMVGDLHGSVIEDLLKDPSSAPSWLLVSRFNSKYEPVVMLLPLDSVLEGSSLEASEEGGAMLDWGHYDIKDLNKHWQCPWGFTIVDVVAPAFKILLEENYTSSSIPLEDTKKNRTLWWMRRKRLDSQIGEFLRKMEDLWFGRWRCVLLGEQSNCKQLDSLAKNLARNIKSKCKMDISESFLKVILAGARCASDIEKSFDELLCLREGCAILKAGNSIEDKCNISPKVSQGLEALSGLVVQWFNQHVNELVAEDSVNREPVVLVPDFEVQMLPWENLPVLRNEEVYRMPSVGSVCMLLDRNFHQWQEKPVDADFPLIDPLDAFYLLNPSGDLSSTQLEFENWFRDQKLEGKAGTLPAAEELALALKSHDLFIYFGHGSGAQYLPSQEIQKLDRCAASLLMGCSSGSLSLNGSYVPQGTPLSYLLAGSPLIIANLWEVTDKDIDRFGKAMLEALLNERSGISVHCPQCDLLKEELEAMSLKGGKCHSKTKISRKKVGEECSSLGSYSCCHRPKIGAFMSRAREACALPYLIGAAPVCYGVPTGIKRKDL